MIAYLKGKILKKTVKGIILDTKNIGYFVNLTIPLISEIKENQDIELFIHTHVKEDSLDLYGFQTYQDLEFFNQLISIGGIGPKVALEILSVPQEKIKAAILNEDEAFICKIPGIGKKTAKRIILELKDKIDESENREYQSITPEVHKDTVEALIKLGYQRHEVKRMIKEIPEDLTEVEEIITFLLKNS